MKKLFIIVAILLMTNTGYTNSSINVSGNGEGLVKLILKMATHCKHCGKQLPKMVEPKPKLKMSYRLTTNKPMKRKVN